jgi:hypothetical protein
VRGEHAWFVVCCVPPRTYKTNKSVRVSRWKRQADLLNAHVCTNDTGHVVSKSILVLSRLFA